MGRIPVRAALATVSLVTILSGCEINNFAGQSAKSVCYNLVAMFDLFRLWLGAVLRGFRTRRSLILENLALRQQLAVFKRQQPRPRLGAIDKLFWVVARRFWAHWEKALPYGQITHPRFQGKEGKFSRPKAHAASRS